MPATSRNENRDTPKPKVNCKTIGQLVGYGSMIFFSGISDNKQFRQLLGGKIAEETEKFCKALQR